MKQNINIEAEGNELILKNKAGDYVIVPKKYRLEVQDMIKENCHSCIDKLVETLPVMEDYAEDGSIIPNDKKNNFEYMSYTAVQDNTYVAPRVVIPLEQKKKQQFVPREQPVLKADNRTDQERKIAQKYTESVLNPSIRTQIGEALHKPLRWMADPVKGVGDIVSAFAPNSSLAKDLPNTNEETFEHRKKQLSPYMSNKEKINSTINEAIPLTSWASLNTLPVEAAAGNMIKSSKNLIKPISKVVGKTDDAIKAGSKVLNKTDDVVNVAKPISSSVDGVNKQPWQLEELPGLHLKSTMTNNPKGLHTYVAKDGSIDTKSALEHLKRMEGDAKYEVVLKNMQNKYGDKLENMPKRMDYNTLRKNIQDDLWDVGTGKGQQVDEYAGMDMKEFGIIKNDRRISPQHQPTSLGYEKGEVNLVGYSFSNKNKFIGGSDAHNMPKETLGHSRGFTNPKEPGVYYSVERQSNWAQEAGNTLNKTDIELLQRQQKKLPELIKEQDDLIAAGNDTWAIGQKERFQNQLKEVNSKIDSYNRYANASPQEKLVMKNMHERMLQEDVAYAASQGHTKYRLPSEETMAKIQGFKKETKIDDALLGGMEADELITLQNKYNKMPDNVSDADWDNIYNPIWKRIDELNSKKIVELGYNPKQSSILKHTKQSLKDAEKLFDVKLKPITDSKGNMWYEFDIPKKFKEGKGEIKAFTVTGAIGTGVATQSQNQNKNK